jgi:hypothetical protein
MGTAVDVKEVIEDMELVVNVSEIVVVLVLTC